LLSLAGTVLLWLGLLLGCLLKRPSFFIKTNMDEINEEQIVCLDVGGERHYIKRGLLAR
jgi:hypothetical protein